jgi:hypothetical protein
MLFQVERKSYQSLFFIYQKTVFNLIPYFNRKFIFCVFCETTNFRSMQNPDKFSCTSKDYGVKRLG